MKIAFIAFLFAATAFAQKTPAALPAACGPENINFDVKLDKSQHTLDTPEAGKARVYFLEDSATVRIGLDGAWVGANRGHSYFSVSVGPGEHHLCVKAATLDHPIELVHFTAEAGEVYFFRGRVLPATDGMYLLFGQSDSDEAKSLIGSYARSVSTQRKQEAREN
ncbi:MAG: hypothetical protein P4L03_03230 [Terracidiphilus sp.]|nr:hypothetical protein [Terracidiphilus sp.]